MLFDLEWEPATYSRESVSEIRRSAAPLTAPLVGAVGVSRLLNVFRLSANRPGEDHAGPSDGRPTTRSRPLAVTPP